MESVKYHSYIACFGAITASWRKHAISKGELETATELSLTAPKIEALASI
jgi:hypothetical protein